MMYHLPRCTLEIIIPRVPPSTLYNPGSGLITFDRCGAADTGADVAMSVYACGRRSMKWTCTSCPRPSRWDFTSALALPTSSQSFTYAHGPHFTKDLLGFFFVYLLLVRDVGAGLALVVVSRVVGGYSH
jgi:hypothetical protein